MKMILLKWRQKIVMLVAATLCMIAFAADSYGPLGVTGAVLYMPVIVLSSFSRSRVILSFISILSTILMSVAYAVTYSPHFTMHSLVNILMEIMVIWIIAVMCFILMKKDDRMQLLARIVQYCPDAILTKDLSGIITSWNRGAEIMYGYTASEMIGKPVSTIFPDNRDEELEFILKTIRSGELIRQFETCRRCKDGRIIEVSLTASPIIAPNGEVFAAAAIARDITNYKKLQRELSDLNAQLKKHAVEKTVELEHVKSHLKKSGEYFQNLIENSIDLITVIDREGTITFQNDSSQRYLGYSPEEMIGKSFLDFLQPGNMMAFLEALSYVKREWEDDTFLEFSVQHKDGSWRDLEAVMLDLKENDQISGIVINARDITEHKRVTQEVLQAIEDERLRMAQELHDGMTQELVAIEFMTKTLIGKAQEHAGESVKGLIQDMEAIGGHVREVTNGTRQLARGLYPMGLEAANFSSVVNNLIEELKVQHEVQIEFICGTGLDISKDQTAGHLYHVILEALRNAILHGKSTEIRVDLSKKNNAIVLVIRDNGKGFSDKKKRGRGIGLKIMQHRVKMMKGFFQIENNDQGGATISCTIPVDEAAETKMVP